MLEESKGYVRIWKEWELRVKPEGCQPVLQWLQMRRVRQKKCHLPLTDYQLWAVFTPLFYLIFLGSRNLYKLMCSQIHRFWNDPILCLLIWILMLASNYEMCHYPLYKWNDKADIPGLPKNGIVWGMERAEHGVCLGWACGHVESSGILPSQSSTEMLSFNARFAQVFYLDI